MMKAMKMKTKKRNQSAAVRETIAEFLEAVRKMSEVTLFGGAALMGMKCRMFEVRPLNQPPEKVKRWVQEQRISYGLGV
jgi:hypothetical protein